MIGSTGFCPPRAVRLLPMKTMVASRVPIAQFPGGIEEQAVRGYRAHWPQAPATRFEAKCAQTGGNLWHPLDVTRRNEEKKIGKIAPQLEKNAAQDFLFSRVGAAGEQDRSTRINAKGLEDGLRDLGVRARRFRDRI